MATISDLSQHVRSKNAGPFWVTMDVFCDDAKNYEAIKASPNMNAEVIGKLYEVAPAQVKIFFVDNINVVKVSIPREVPQGDPYERDMHGGQMYIQLAQLTV